MLLLLFSLKFPWFWDEEEEMKEGRGWREDWGSEEEEEEWGWDSSSLFGLGLDSFDSFDSFASWRDEEDDEEGEEEERWEQEFE